LQHLADARMIEVVVIHGQEDSRTGRLVLDRSSRDLLAAALERALGQAGNE
jgi:hypothetical protein